MPNADDSERDFWVGITAFGAVLGTGLYALVDHEWWFGAIYTIGGGSGLMWMSPAAKSRLGAHPSPRILMAAVAAAWIFLSANIGVSVYDRWIAPQESPSPVNDKLAPISKPSESTPEPTTAPRPTPIHTKTDIERLLSLLPAVSNIIDDADKMSVDFSKIAKHSFLYSDKASQFAWGVADKLTALGRERQQFINDHKYDRNELANIFSGIDIDKWHGSVWNYALDIQEQTQTMNSTPATTMEVLDNADSLWRANAEVASNAKDFFVAWVAAMRDRVQQKKQELAAEQRDLSAAGNSK